jgi:transposase InsO family protein
LTELVRAIHAASRGTYGWRRVNAELTYGHGVIVNRKTVRKIMRLQGLHGLPGSRKTIRGKATMATAADLVERQFARPAPDQLWVTDITEHPTREGKVYCCVVLDVFSRRVVGWSSDGEVWMLVWATEVPGAAGHPGRSDPWLYVLTGTFVDGRGSRLAAGGTPRAGAGGPAASGSRSWCRRREGTARR